MPSQFSGLFYVNEIINRDLHCYFTNENGDALPLTITYFYTRLIADSAPSTAAYIQVHAKKVYWLQGIITFPDQNFQSPMVSYFTAMANRSYKAHSAHELNPFNLNYDATTGQQKTPLDLIAPSHLTITATVRIDSDVRSSNSYPDWAFFTGCISQNSHVLSLFLLFAYWIDLFFMVDFQ